MVEIAADYNSDLSSVRNKYTLPAITLAGYSIVADRIVNDVSAFYSLIPSIINAHPDVIVLCGSAAETSAAKTQAQTAGLLR